MQNELTGKTGKKQPRFELKPIDPALGVRLVMLLSTSLKILMAMRWMVKATTADAH